MHGSTQKVAPVISRAHRGGTLRLAFLSALVSLVVSFGLAVDFVLVSDRTQLSEIIQRVRDGRLRTNIGNIASLDDAVAAFNPIKRISGKTIIRLRP